LVVAGHEPVVGYEPARRMPEPEVALGLGRG
jgi:hypothetical protein